MMWEVTLLESAFWSGSDGFPPTEIFTEVRRKGHLSLHHHSPGSAVQLLPTALDAAKLPERKGRHVRGDCTCPTSRGWKVPGETLAGHPVLFSPGSKGAGGSLGLH